VIPEECIILAIQSYSLQFILTQYNIFTGIKFRARSKNGIKERTEACGASAAHSPL
jgi:hypothetical protein